MGAMTAVMTWRQQTDAVHTVQRDMDGALTGVDQSLQLVYAGATDRVLKLLPALKHALGGGLPELDGKTADTGDASGVPSLSVNGIPINDNIRPLLGLRRSSGADANVVVRVTDHWVYATTDRKSTRLNSRT